jgi:hypothetical protein
MSKVTLTFCAGKDRRLTWVRKDEDYVADFCLVSRRTLDDFEHRVFRYHFLLGADWRLCCRQMKIDRGTFFHAVYRVEQKLAGLRDPSPTACTLRMNISAERFGRRRPHRRPS